MFLQRQLGGRLDVHEEWIQGSNIKQMMADLCVAQQVSSLMDHAQRDGSGLGRLDQSFGLELRNSLRYGWDKSSIRQMVADLWGGSSTAALVFFLQHEMDHWAILDLGFPCGQQHI